MAKLQPSQASEILGSHTSFAGWRWIESAAPLESLQASVWSDPGVDIRTSPDFPSRFDLVFRSVASIRVDFSECSITAHRYAGTTGLMIEHLIINQVMPRILAHLDHLVIHASAIRSPRGTFLFTGLSRSGKSTLAAQFLSHGFDLVSDDAILVERGEGGLAAQPLHQSLRLFSDSLSHTLGNDATVSPVAPHTTKKKVENLPQGKDQARSDLVACFLLEPRPSAAVRSERLSDSRACMALVENMFWFDPYEPARLKRRVASAAELAEQAPVWRITYPHDFALLDELQHHILDRVAEAA